MQLSRFCENMVSLSRCTNDVTRFNYTICRMHVTPEHEHANAVTSPLVKSISYEDDNGIGDEKEEFGELEDEEDDENDMVIDEEEKRVDVLKTSERGERGLGKKRPKGKGKKKGGKRKKGEKPKEIVYISTLGVIPPLLDVKRTHLLVDQNELDEDREDDDDDDDEDEDEDDEEN